MSKPKLELQVNIPTTMKLLQSEPATGENSYGRWYLYSVECDGTEYSYFAPEKVVKMLRENEVSVSDEVVITKKLIKNGKKNLTDYEVSVLESTATAEERSGHRSEEYKNALSVNGRNGHSADPVQGAANGTTVAYANGNGSAGRTNVRSPVLSKDYQVMLQCMTEAMILRDELGHDIDVNKLGITLFLRKVKP